MKTCTNEIKNNLEVVWDTKYISKKIRCNFYKSSDSFKVVSQESPSKNRNGKSFASERKKQPKSLLSKFNIFNLSMKQSANR